ncbi:MAG TPA: Txe/YoeB family addiction module toxin [Cytophagales bacterium]|jgi:toxin YoeB|nr:Txe/YoeB family addiction module toxin [Cytophagales bacterium]
MEIIYLPKADEDLTFWMKTGNKQVLKRRVQLTEAILKNPYKGIGKPEALKYQLTGKWSRRINKVRRFVYAINDNTLYVYSLKGHY